MRFAFGVYHWRERGRRLAVAALAVAVGLWGVRRREEPVGRALAAAVALWGLRRGWRTAAKLLRPPPWHVDREKYAALAAAVDLSGADRLLDVGCGTGRSLVGLAPAVPDGCTVLGLDVFDDRVILGNAPGLARWNAAAAGLTAEIVRGDAARLPVADGAVDVVTASRVLHDLPAEDARRALAEARRVCAPDGRLGLLALPYPHEDGADPADYWRDLVADAGFTVRSVETLTTDRNEYVVVGGEP
ncbi:methyltransferase type 11 [Halobacteriales archaeon QS_1_68_17]|nr:MAG: methyltransferase type 11 [Halobacteriales archaeon QS_1_68_17]